MIKLVSGNLLEAQVEALVNTVNTVGVMGKGVALQFRETFPENYKAYQKACRLNEVQIGKMFVFTTGLLSLPRYIINFPTKRHWRDKSRLEDIEAGLFDLVQVGKQHNIHSLALPPLGCGAGGLNWNDVRPLIEQALSGLTDTTVLLYPPAGSPRPDEIRPQTPKADLNLGRAALVYLVDQYALPAHRLTLLEVQKLMYFLQEAGQPLKLNYVRQLYGPYAENLNHVLQRLEGHYLSGYGDRTGRATIRAVPGAKAEAETFLSEDPETLQRLKDVLKLIEGFETPYGMELLSTVHWLARENPAVKTDYQLAVQGFESWNRRKREHFRPEHIKVAWERLRQQGWI